MAISEKIRLLGKGLYKDIPDVLTLKALPTISELDYISGEDYDRTMLEKILPQAIEEKINPKELLELDYYWVCRCLRFLNYGPYYTSNVLYCEHCGALHGEYRVDLRAVECRPLPEGFVNHIKVSADSLMSFDKDIVVRLLTIQERLNAYQDKQFARADGSVDRQLARICYMVKSIGEDDKLSPIDVRLILEQKLSSADYIMLKDAVSDLTDYGLRAGGSTRCPRCGRPNAASFVALVDDRFLRPTVGDLREWKHNRASGRDTNLFGNPSEDVRKDS